MGKYRKRSKYHNEKVIDPNYGAFDSRKEYRRFLFLKNLEANGSISRLERQVPFELIPSQRGEDGKVIERKIEYKADFVYANQAGELVVEDAKGFRTQEYILKRKLMLYMHHIKITEV